MARYTRCNPFGSEKVRFGDPCVASPADIAAQAAAQWARQEKRLAALAALHPLVLPVAVTDCFGILASSGRILASSGCRIQECPDNILASSDRILASNGCRIKGCPDNILASFDRILASSGCHFTTKECPDILLASSGRTLASNVCRLSHFIPNFLASTGAIKASSTNQIIG